LGGHSAFAKSESVGWATNILTESWQRIASGLCHLLKLLATVLGGASGDNRTECAACQNRFARFRASAHPPLPWHFLSPGKPQPTPGGTRRSSWNFARGRGTCTVLRTGFVNHILALKAHLHERRRSGFAERYNRYGPAERLQTACNRHVSHVSLTSIHPFSNSLTMNTCENGSVSGKPLSKFR